MKIRVSRESRLLLLTILVSTLVLLALARLRFPETPIVDAVAPPLERLAQRASYDALVAAIERVETSITPSLVVLRITSESDAGPRATHDVLQVRDQRPVPRHVAALRIDGVTAVAALDADMRIAGIVGPTQNRGTAAVLASDPIRRLARLRVPEAPVRPLATLALASLRTPVYVVAVEGTQAGVTLRPVFLGRSDRFGTARWARPLLPLGGMALTEGALLFSLDGEFVGTVVVEDGALAIAGAADVLETAERLASASVPVPATAGIAVQPLTALLAEATGAGHGVVVSHVEPEGPAVDVLQASDVITAVDDRPTDTPDRFLLHIASRPVGQTVNVAFVRLGQSRTATLTLAALTLPAVQASIADRPPRGGGLAFAAERGGGSRVVAVGTNTPLAEAGLREGDIVMRAGDIAAPTPAQLRRLLDQRSGEFVFLIVARDGRQQVIAFRPSGSADASGE